MEIGQNLSCLITPIHIPIQHFDNSNSGLKIEDLPDTDHSDLAQNWMLSGFTIR